MVREDDDRRWKIAYIGPCEILALFQPISENAQCVPRVIIEGLPADYKIDSINYNFTQQRYEFLIHHPSFENVELGAIPPTLQEIVFVRYCLPVFDSFGEMKDVVELVELTLEAYRSTIDGDAALDDDDEVQRSDRGLQSSTD